MFIFDPVIYVCQNQHDVIYTTTNYRGETYNATLYYNQARCNYFSGLVYSTAIPLILNTLFVTYYW